MLVRHESRKEASNDFPKSFIESVVAATDIVRVISTAVDLKSSGHNLFGCCPFHKEKSPSFSVSAPKQFYHCFGCGASGDVIKFVQEHGGLSFREAVMELAESARIPLPAANGTNAQSADLGALFSANTLAGQFFRHCLRHTDSAKDYLRKRKMPGAAAQRFLIGFAPEGWQSLQEAFPDYATNPHIVDMGLVIEKDGRRYDRFRQRVMFGIRDARGRILGWGGREIDGSEPKYLNSPQSVIFDKSNTLFGIFEAREGIRQSKQVIVTEGYMDTIAHSMAGLTQTVATMGTACTPQHLERLINLAPEIIFSFDGDKAGLAAARRSLNTCLPFAEDGRSFRFFILPDGMDPDELILSEGIDAYKKRLEKSLTLSGFLLTQLAIENNQLESAEDRAKFLKDGLALIQQLPSKGNLQKILRQEITKASKISAAEIVILSKDAALNKPVYSGKRSVAWLTLAEAATSQKQTASNFAHTAIEMLSPDMQGAFFSGNLSALPDHQRPFWDALQKAILDDRPLDLPTDLCMAQRDVLARCAEIISKEMEKEKRLQIKASFRDGSITEQELLGQPVIRPTPQ